MTIRGVSLNAPLARSLLASFRAFILVRVPAHAEQDTEKEDETNEQVLSKEAIDEVVEPLNQAG